MAPAKRTSSEKSSSATAEDDATAATETILVTTNSQEADRIIREHVGWSCAGGLLPVPLLDIAAVTGVQLRLVRELSRLYKVPYKEHTGRNLIASLIGGVGSAAVGRGIFCSVLKAVPVVGAIGGLISVPIVAGAATYALGKVFVEHFETGGTLLDFDSKEMRSYFEEKMKEGQKVARETWEKTTRRVSR